MELYLPFCSQTLDSNSTYSSKHQDDKQECSKKADKITMVMLQQTRPCSQAH